MTPPFSEAQKVVTPPSPPANFWQVPEGQPSKSPILFSESVSRKSNLCFPVYISG